MEVECIDCGEPAFLNDPPPEGHLCRYCRHDRAVEADRAIEAWEADQARKFGYDR